MVKQPLKRLVIKRKLETCYVCGCKSNVSKWVQSCIHAGYHSICPGKQKHPALHEELKEKLEALKSKQHPRRYIQELEKEVRELKKKFIGIKPLQKAPEWVKK